MKYINHINLQRNELGKLNVNTPILRSHFEVKDYDKNKQNSAGHWEKRIKQKPSYIHGISLDLCI